MKRMIIAMALIILAAGAFAIVNKVSPAPWGLWREYNPSSGLAIKGYDPVAYFVAAKPVPGKSQFTVEWGGTRWQFANARNRDLFLANPESFAPQFGGFCSFAAGRGFTADVSPDAWYIHEQKLYLFANEKMRRDWVTALEKKSLKASEINCLMR